MRNVSFEQQTIVLYNKKIQKVQNRDKQEEKKVKYRDPIIVISEPPNYTKYDFALKTMDDIVEKIHNYNMEDVFWLLEHNHVYTAGRSVKAGETLTQDIQVTQIGRGGKTTYHGAGQKVFYIMVNLKKMHGDKRDIREYIKAIEYGIIKFLAKFKIKGQIKEGLIGVWVDKEDTVLVSDKNNHHKSIKDKNSEKPKKWCKIASVGVGVKKGITMHGCAINISTDLNMFCKILPCGMDNVTMCSVKSLFEEQGEKKTEWRNCQFVNKCIINAFLDAFNFKPWNGKNNTIEELIAYMETLVK
ncbi:MAG: hypothetical protein JJW01_00615 [Alphaproteobacteria bacterium]|nr:hypothetical protein [Rickettsiales bacterium]